MTRGASAADVVVVGAGSAGAVVASHLSEDRGRHVLLVEAGPDYRSAATPAPVRTADFARALAVRPLHWATLRALLNDEQGRERMYVCGRGVGGSSAINAQSALRGLPGDFAAWAAMGCPGWEWGRVAKSFRALESDAEFGDRSTHGATGPLPVERMPWCEWGPTSRAVFEAAVTCGHPEVDDLNAPGASGIGPTPWNRRNGERVSTNDAYLEAARPRSNLRIRGETFVRRVVFRGSQVRGVEVVRDDGVQLVETERVVLCAGAVHSPTLLLRSGIGPAAVLRSHGIEVVADRPGVGGNLRDHPIVFVALEHHRAARDAVRHPSPSSCSLRFSSDPTEGADDLLVVPIDRAVTGLGGASLMVGLVAPTSTGSVQFGDGADGEPRVALNMLRDRGDRRRLAVGFRTALTLARRSGVSDSNQLSGTDGTDFDRWLVANCRSLSHAHGSCSMGDPNAATTVVDPTGAVVGVDGLQVADASVIPVSLRAPTHLTTVMLAHHLFLSGRDVGVARSSVLEPVSSGAGMRRGAT